MTRTLAEPSETPPTPSAAGGVRVDLYQRLAVQLAVGPWWDGGDAQYRKFDRKLSATYVACRVTPHGDWKVNGPMVLGIAAGYCSSQQDGMSAADAAARAMGYVLEPRPGHTPEGWVINGPEHRRSLGLTPAPDTPLSLAVTVPQTLPGLIDDAHSTCSQHGTRFLATSYCAGCAILRDALGELLRFILGLPQGSQWMGAERWRALALHGSDWMRKGGDGRTTLEPADLATRLLASLGDVPACATSRWLSVAEQREYLRMTAALREALR